MGVVDTLLFLGICPAIYNTFRIYLVGNLPSTWAYSIAGQLAWVNLIYEVINEALILPLYHFLNTSDDKAESSWRIRSGLLISIGIYALLAILMIVFTEPLLRFMAVNVDIIQESASYIRIESVANIFIMISSFLTVALVSTGKDIFLYVFAFARLVLSLMTDYFFVSEHTFSLRLGINGIGWSNIVVNGILALVAALMLQRDGIAVFSARCGSWKWLNTFCRKGALSGLESLVRNLAYMVMIVRMVNVVSEQGTYWVANGFIWSWLLLPVLQLGELIKKETAKQNYDCSIKALRKWFALTGASFLYGL